MNEPIGEYIRKRLRFKNISNEMAGKCIGISESAFEKTLLKDDISVDRLVKLSGLLEEDLLIYYSDYEPIKTARQKELAEWEAKIAALNEKLDSKDKLLMAKEELLETQRRLLAEMEAKLNKG